MNDLKQIKIVLVATTHPGNIGAAARAMKTMGLGELCLVTPKYFPDVRAIEMAAGAEDILQQCEVYDSLAEALKDCQLILGTSARPRGIALPGLLPAEAGQLVVQKMNAMKIAVIFGRESSGLTNEELLQCHYHIHIPANEAYSSLNLAQAVQIIAYEMRMNYLNPKIDDNLQSLKTLATHQDLEGFYQHLKQLLISIGFLKMASPKRLEQRLRRLFSRTGLEKMEVNILRGILTHIQQRLSLKKEPDEA